MSDRGRLAVKITDGQGYTSRISPDEVDAGNLLQDLSFSSSAPGGHKDASFTLIRDRFPRLDEAPFNRVSVYSAGGMEVWGGRVATLPRQTGTNFSLSPTCVGMQAHLADDTAFVEIYADRDPGSFSTEPPLTRKAALATGGFNQSSANGLGANIEGGLAWEVALSVPAEAVAEIWYTAPGSARVKAMEYNGTRSGTWTGFESPKLFGFDTPTTGQISTTDANFGLSMHETILTSAKRHAMLRVYNASGGTLTPPLGTRQTIDDVGVYGNHGLSRYFYDNTKPSGVKGADVVADVVSRAAPLLDFTTGTDGTIQPTGSLIIPHLVFRSPTTAADAIKAVNAFYGWDWLVWGTTFHYQPAGSGTVWRARAAAGAALSAEGPSADELFNGAHVTFTDIDGVTKLAGPTGSGFEVESATLLDADTANAVNAADIPRRWLPVDATRVGITTPDTAVAIGAAQLAEANTPKRRGQITLQGQVEHPSGALIPVSEVRAGDSVIFSDTLGYPPQRIDECSYSHASRTATLGINGPLSLSESLLERLALFTGLIN